MESKTYYGKEEETQKEAELVSERRQSSRKPPGSHGQTCQ